MVYNHPAWVEHQRWRSMRHDWKRWVTPALAKEMEATHPAARKRAARREREEKAALAEWQADQDEIARLRIAIADLKFALALWRIREAKYSQTQPRVPAGNADGGQWTDGAGAGRNDPRVIFDATPDPVRPGAQYAMGRRVTVSRIIGGRLVEVEPGQAARLVAAEARAQDGLRRVQDIDPFWKTEPSLAAPQSIEGAIARREADARDAEARLDVLNRLGIGPVRMRGDGDVRSTVDILTPGGNLIGVQERRAGDNIRTVRRRNSVKFVIGCWGARRLFRRDTIITDCGSIVRMERDSAFG